MLVAIHQLHYLPWLRYFEKIQQADAFIVLDDIQFNKNGWQNRNHVKSAQGSVLLTVPVFSQSGQRLDEVRVNNETRWRTKHWRTLEQSYHKSPHFSEYGSFLRETFAREWDRLNALNRHLLEYFIEALGISTPVHYSSELKPEGVATERLANLVVAVGGDAYYSGAHAVHEYLDTSVMKEAGIELVLQEWRAPVYEQAHGAFIPDLSIVDLLMNCGPASLEVLMQNVSQEAG